MSKPVGEQQVEPTTRFRDRREEVDAKAEEEEVLAASLKGGRARMGERDMRWRKGELEGVNFRRLDGVDAIVFYIPSGWCCVDGCRRGMR